MQNRLLVITIILLLIVCSACSLSLQGGNGLNVAGNSTSNTVTLALDGSVVRGVLTDSGNATGSDNWLSMLGAGNVTISASGNTITITCEGGAGGNATYALDSDKLDGQHGSYYLTTTGTAADSTLFYGFTALDWTSIIDAQIVSGTSGNSDKLDGQHGSYYIAAVTGVLASDTIRNSNNTEKTTTSTSYVKKKEIKVNATLANCRVYCEIHRSGAGTAYYTLYKNGSPVGVEHIRSTGTYQGFTDDLAGLVANDLLQIYVKSSTSDAAYCANMSLRYSNAILSISGFTLVVPLVDTVDPTISVTNQDP